MVPGRVNVHGVAETEVKFKKIVIEGVKITFREVKRVTEGFVEEGDS